MRTGKNQILGDLSVTSRATLSGNITQRDIERLEVNTMLLGFYRAQDLSKTIYNLVDSFIDEYLDQSGVDTGASINESYNASYYYEPITDPYTKLLTHADGSNEGVSFTDEIGKTITNSEVYDSFTKLMLHFENNVTDSATAKSVTNNNVTFSSSTKKLGSYSAYFNGSSAYLTIPDSDDWAFGTGAFTIDFWVNFGGLSTTTLFSHATDGNNFYYLEYQSSLNGYLFTLYGSGEYVLQFSIPTVPSTSTWYHLALVRINGSDSESSWKFFINGISTALNKINGNWNGSIGNYTGAFHIGRWSNSAVQYLNGYIDEFRVSKGSARWISNFTPYRSAYGKVATITADKKFGTACAEFKGSGESLSLIDSDDWNFGSGDFTIDLWVNLTVISSSMPILQQLVSGNTYNYLFLTDSRIQFISSNGGVDVIGVHCNTTWTAGTWYHIALVRNSNTWYMFINGTSLSLTLDSGSYSGSLPDFSAILKIGNNNNSTYLNGYIEELRLSKGIARWTSNFSVPTSAYNNKTDVILQSLTQTAQDTPTDSRIVIMEEDVDTVTLNTDLKAYISRDGGTTWTQGTLTKEGTASGNKNILTATADISSQPSGTSMKYKLTTHNTKNLKIHGVGLSWD